MTAHDGACWDGRDSSSDDGDFLFRLRSVLVLAMVILVVDDLLLFVVMLNEDVETAY